ncbi:AN1-type zinc finger protein 1-like [Artemia franciscana]
MAELPDLGKHCGLGSCKQIDFLPILCNFCQTYFCKEHIFTDDHLCKAVNSSAPKVLGKIGTHECSFPNCCHRDVSRLECPGCSKHFCLTHRFPDTHSCISYVPPKEYMPETSKLVRKIQEKAVQLSRPMVGKSSKMSAKVQLMKIKQKAIGLNNIPQEEKVFFLVKSEKGDIPVFVSKYWSVGKAVDSIASLCNVVNNNHKLNVPKLCLFKEDTNLYDRTGAKIMELVESEFSHSGSTHTLKLFISE